MCRSFVSTAELVRISRGKRIGTDTAVCVVFFVLATCPHPALTAVSRADSSSYVEKYKRCGHKKHDAIDTPYCNAVSRVDNANDRPSYTNGYDRRRVYLV